MGQGLDVLKTCDGEGAGPRRDGACSSEWDEDTGMSCGMLEEGVKNVVASANRGNNKISNEVLLNHELLQYARSGNVRGLSEALEKGAWTETRRPLVMKPQKPDRQNGGMNDNDGDEEQVGMTALMFSAQCGSSECIRRLLWANAEVNAVEEDGWTALHFAAKEGHLEVCSKLLQARANAQQRNCDDKTALEVAQADDSEFATKFDTLLKRYEVREPEPHS
mmetsp:Transcript_8077/g.15278  ORF Transcript_8077/g.15278 Transcript_8077/m.15278 type:complete len:221 (-) Transcript_8077:153-815(-)